MTTTISARTEVSDDVFWSGERELFLQDPAWVEAEFMAIMAASGLADPVAVGTDPPSAPPSSLGKPVPRTRLAPRTPWVRRNTAGTRVRSPPTRKSPPTSR